MKGPNSFKHELGNNNPVREAIYCGRRIIGNFDMRADETYYFRIKIPQEMHGYMYLDYLELVPRSVYDNPSKAEDICKEELRKVDAVRSFLNIYSI